MEARIDQYLHAEPAAVASLTLPVVVATSASIH
jgi:hypothetical protein